MDKIIVLCGNVEYNHTSSRKTYSAEGISPCLTAAMGMGGGFVPRILVEE